MEWNDWVGAIGGGVGLLAGLAALAVHGTRLMDWYSLRRERRAKQKADQAYETGMRAFENYLVLLRNPVYELKSECELEWARRAVSELRLVWVEAGISVKLPSDLPPAPRGRFPVGPPLRAKRRTAQSSEQVVPRPTRE